MIESSKEFWPLLMKFKLLCSAGKDHNTGQNEPIDMGLDASLEYIAEDELVEVGLLCMIELA